MLQVPNLPTQYQLPQPSYNAVKIDIHNPSVGTPAQVPAQTPAQAPNSQYATPTAPQYSYPQAQLYDYPQASGQPYYMPQAQQPQAYTCPPCPACEPKVLEQPLVPQVQVPQPVVTQVNNNAPQAPIAPVAVPAPAQATPQAAQPVEVVPPVQVAPQIDLNGFLAKLANPDYEIQANTMEEIANMVKDQPQKATELLDAKIIDSLTGIINSDSSKLSGPTQEQIAARQKMMSGQQISDAEKTLATTITPMEQAERNKSYAMFTSAILQKLYGDEVSKITGQGVPLTELPGAVQVVEQLKNNANPMVRTSAIEALSYIQNPTYKQDLTTLFSIAKNDQDKSVSEAATAALEKLNQV